MANPLILDYLCELLQLLILKALTIIVQLIALPFEILSVSYQYWMLKPKTFSSICITGASSGIGLQFALQISKQRPPPTLVLIARRIDKLKEAQQACINNGCHHVEIYSCDVTNTDKMREIMEKCDAQYSFDCVFANAGYRSNVTEDIISGSYKTLNVNINGVLNTILPVIPNMIARKHGHIIINASIAGLTPHKLFPFYSISKHALVALAENLRCNLNEHNIGVTVTLPGFVETDLVSHLSDSKLPMIGKISALEAVYRIQHAAVHNQAISSFPFISSILGYLYDASSPYFKQTVLDYNIIDRIIGWHASIPNRKWHSD